ncbi:MAG TPA: site-specific tyrosine recombinase XerD [Acidimicrobiia bacterium]|nr:site-specific tyrosine recombinase XerD [Acidimicrobiia bacterium]
MTGLRPGVEDYLSSLTAERGLSAHTIAAYRRDLDQYLDFLDEKEPEPSDIDDFVDHLHRRSLAPASVARKVAAVRGLHRFLVSEGLALEDPTRLLDPAKPRESFPKALTVEQTFALVEAPDVGALSGRRDRALLEFLYGTGARVSEAVGIDLPALDLEAKTVILTGKGDKQRLVPLGSSATASVVAWLPDRLAISKPGAASEALFLNRRGGRLSRQSAFRIVRHHAARVGIDPATVSPHTLRHSAATHMVEGGADLRSVQVMLGHARISTTQVYTRVSPQHLVEVFYLSHPRSR